MITAKPQFNVRVGTGKSRYVKSKYTKKKNQKDGQKKRKPF